MHVSQVVKEVSYAAGEVIVREGDASDALFVVKAGECIAYKAAEGEACGKEIARMGERMFFGESAIESTKPQRKTDDEEAKATHQPRAATVVAAGQVTLLRCTAVDFAALLGDLAAVVRDNFNQKVLSSMELFTTLSDTEKAAIVEALVEIRFEEGEHIVSEGTVGARAWAWACGRGCTGMGMGMRAWAWPHVGMCRSASPRQRGGCGVSEGAVVCMRLRDAHALMRWPWATCRRWATRYTSSNQARSASPRGRTMAPTCCSTIVSRATTLERWRWSATSPAVPPSRRPRRSCACNSKGAPLIA